MKHRILVVDDDRSILELLRLLLEAEGYRVQAFDSAISALQSALAEPPEAAVVDLMMPGMNGLDLIQALRFDPRTQDVPILVCSAYFGELPAAEASAGEGSITHIRKPFHVDDLLAAVAAMFPVGRRQSRRAARSGAVGTALAAVAGT